MGYEGDTFLSDSRKPVMTEDLVDKLGVIREKSYIRFIDCFIGNYLYTIASPYDFFDYTDLVERMRRMEPELAAIIDDMFNRWREYDIENEKNILAISYNDIIGDFVRNLESWYN